MEATADIAWSGPTPGKAKAGQKVDVSKIPPSLLARWTEGDNPVLVEDA